jgi:hypothetical protein
VAKPGGVVFLFDENSPQRVARALRELGEQAHHVLEFLSPSTPDELVLRFVGDRGWCLITRDQNILRKPQERAVISEMGLGVFFLDSGIRQLWDIVKTVVRNWEEMKRIAESESKPFIYLVRRSSVTKLRPRHLG